MSATVTMRWTDTSGRPPSPGTIRPATAAPARNSVGAGTRITAANRLDVTATSSATATSSTSRPKSPTSLIDAPSP